jgi:hypothetical protein
LIGRLSACAERRKNDKACSKRNALHVVPPNELLRAYLLALQIQQSS